MLLRAEANHKGFCTDNTWRPFCKYFRPIRFAVSKLKFWRHANMDPEMESQLVPLFTWVGAREGGIADVA